MTRSPLRSGPAFTLGSLDDGLDAAAHGPRLDPARVLGARGGGFAAAAPLRAELAQAAHHAAAR